MRAISAPEYPSESIDGFTRTVTITNDSIANVPGYQIRVTLSHSLLDNLSLTLFCNSN